MINIIKTRVLQKYQAIRDIRKAEIGPAFRGFPGLDAKLCSLCGKCAEACPTKAVNIKPLSIDMGRCVFCGECESACETGSISFTNRHRLSSTSKERLVVQSGDNPEDYSAAAVVVKKEIKSMFGRSFKLRQVSAGGCGGCEWELNACNNVNFDMCRFGFEFTASPRHADAIVITGPVTANMAEALIEARESMPEPCLVVAAGTCSISGGIFADSVKVDQSPVERLSPDLYIPGCPVHPLTVINGILDLLGR